MSARTCSFWRAVACLLAALLSPFVDPVRVGSYESGRLITRGGTVKPDGFPARSFGALWVVSRRLAGGHRGAAKLREDARLGHGHDQSCDAGLLRGGALLEARAGLHARVLEASSGGPGEDERPGPLS